MMVLERNCKKQEMVMKVIGKVLIGIMMLALLAIPGRALAQDATPAAAVSGGTVTVLGSGTVKVKPDTALVQMGVNIQQETLPGALDEANATMSAIIQALTDIGIAEDDVQTANFNVYAVRDYSKEATAQLPPLVGYSVTNQVAVTIRDLVWQQGMPSEKVGEAITAAIEAGANDIYGVTFSVDDTKEAEREARAMAVENANERAAELASAAGKQVGEVVAMSEGVTFSPVGFIGKSEGDQRGGAGGVPIMGGTVEIAIDVTVTYELL
jgi:uncharacterized protein YggE